ncbi:predicted protein [Uncinocarpus reesii 1704]|uniref:Uncharacterized protein n=1 Tax=Uncinocarpus reesii (strain UAMH 1704) TaxID=336963 RepID=C4JEV8_UNCRE|nr:uncharacterized protein UREG_00858 [Uncinocarpus reesii 1704]EEP76011.1 predicted protein [Uncinocarpus reesii 1704]
MAVQERPILTTLDNCSSFSQCRQRYSRVGAVAKFFYASGKTARISGMTRKKASFQMRMPFPSAFRGDGERDGIKQNHAIESFARQRDQERIMIPEDPSKRFSSDFGADTDQSSFSPPFREDDSMGSKETSKRFLSLVAQKAMMSGYQARELGKGKFSLTQRQSDPCRYGNPLARRGEASGRERA